ncbi:MAG TPA: PKD domain-containing protein, partial [Thermoplasmata archaeon]|nr:PKD domain-containing protein [Thermoplasmata archaeon]
MRGISRIPADNRPRPGPALALWVIASVAVLVGTSIAPSGLGAAGRLSARAVDGSPLGHLFAPTSAARDGPGVVPTPSWYNLGHPANASWPAIGWSASTAYDPVDQQFVLFGGCSSVCGTNQTWVFRGGTWFNVTNPHDAPPARFHASMDWDATAGGVLLFGGMAPTEALLNDTWIFRGGFWSNLTPTSNGPSARYGASLAFDPDAGVHGSVLVGGCDYVSVPSCRSDTYVWTPGAGWSALDSLTVPGGRGMASLAYSPADGALVYYGGYAACSAVCPLNDTWELYGGTWWAVHTGSATPSPRLGAAMTYDAELGSLVLFGGALGVFGPFYNDTYTFTGGDWHLLTTAASPPGRYSPAIAPDPTGVGPLVLGGQLSNGSASDAWALEVPPTVSVSPSSATVESTAPLGVSTMVSGGASPFTVRIDFGDHSSGVAADTGSTSNFSHTYAAPGNYTLRATVTDLFGLNGTGIAPVAVVAGPTVSASATPPNTDVGQTVQLSASPTGGTAGGGSATWQFGDGSNGSGFSVPHTYGVAGSYTASVTYVDVAGATSVATVNVRVAAPLAIALWGPASSAAGNLTGFFGNLTGGTCPCAYTWNFGDGLWSTFPAPAHRFAASGTYSVNL